MKKLNYEENAEIKDNKILNLFIGINGSDQRIPFLADTIYIF